MLIPLTLNIFKVILKSNAEIIIGGMYNYKTKYMSSEIIALSEEARRSARAQDWNTVYNKANAILQIDVNHPEGHFLSGLVERVANRPLYAIAAFEQTLNLDGNRYDAAVELANQYSIARRNGEAADLLAKYKDKLHNPCQGFNRSIQLHQC